MPYNPASASKSITVQAISVSLTISPSQPWTAGQTLTITVKVYSNGTLLTNRSVKVFFGFQSVGFAEILSGSTGSTGTFTATWTIPWSIYTTPAGTLPVPCKPWWFRACDVASNVYSSEVVGNIAYPTRISISAPDIALPLQSITLSGKLEYQSSPNVWSPLANRKVSLYIGNVKITDVTTDSNGNYSYTMAVQVGPGTYTLKAVYAGEGFTSLAVAALAVTVGTKTLLTNILPIIMGIALLATSRVKR